MLAALTNRIHAEAMASLPPNVRRRVRALRTLQKEFVDIEAKFYSEVHALECKYENLYKPLFEKVRATFFKLYVKAELHRCNTMWHCGAAPLWHAANFEALAASFSHNVRVRHLLFYNRMPCDMLQFRKVLP